MKFSYLFLLIAAALAFVSCSDSPEKASGTPIELKAQEAYMMADCNRVADRFFSALCENTPGENVVFSPLSLIVDLQMLKEGAKGETAEALAALAGLDEYGNDGARELFKKLVYGMQGVDGQAKLALANSLWTLDASVIQKDYANILADIYRGDVRQASPSTFAKDVNNWCSKSTKGLITNFMSDDAQIDNCLLNALYFKGRWGEDYKFDKKKTAQGAFHNSDGSESMAMYMSHKCSYPYLQASGFTSIAIPFGNGSFCLCMALPDEGVSLGDLTLNALPLSDDSFGASLSLKMPKFEIESCFDLTSLIAQLGGAEILSSSADYSGISPDFKINRIRQAAKLQVDEDGAEAAAVTGSDWILSPGYMPFVIDRPFAFAIVELNTKAILLLGKIEKL